MLDGLRPRLASIVGVGIIIGVALGAAAGRVLTTMLFGVEPLDAMTFAIVIAALLASAGLATAAPAWRAARIDPAVALRSE